MYQQEPTLIFSSEHFVASNVESVKKSYTSDHEMCEKETTSLFHYDDFGVSNVEIGYQITELVILTSNIDLDLISLVFDLRS